MVAPESMNMKQIVGISLVLSVFALLVQAILADGVLQNISGTTQIAGSSITGTVLTNNSTLGWTNTGNIQSATLNTSNIVVGAAGNSPANIGTVDVKANNGQTQITTSYGKSFFGWSRPGSSTIVLDAGNTYLSLRQSGFIYWASSGDADATKTASIVSDSAGIITFNTNGIFKGTITATNSMASYRSNQLAVVTISVGASPFSYTNTSGGNGYVIIDGATAYSATWLNTTVQSSLAGGITLPLQNGEWCTVTYTVAPGMFFKPF